MVTIIKYLVFFIAASLIAPYFGCHILTTPPEQDESTASRGNATESGQPSSVLRQSPHAVEPSLEEDSNSENDEAALAEKEAQLLRETTPPQAGGLSDIQELLGE
jgi:hypothetical protein